MRLSSRRHAELQVLVCRRRPSRDVPQTGQRLIGQRPVAGHRQARTTAPSPYERDTGRAMPDESTTPDLVELTRRVIEAVDRPDFDAVESFYAPDAVLRTAAQGGTFEGAAAIRGLFEDMRRPYEEFHGEAEEITDLGNGVGFAVIVLTGRPVGSSGEIRFRFASVAILTNGVIEREMRNMNIDEARADAERLAKERG